MYVGLTNKHGSTVAADRQGPRFIRTSFRTRQYFTSDSKQLPASENKPQPLDVGIFE